MASATWALLSYALRLVSNLLCLDGKETSASASRFGGAAAAQQGKLLNVRRGVNGTTATAHHSGATVTLLPPPPCIGDCNGSDDVTVDEILTLVNIALDHADVSMCMAGNANGDAQITVNEILSAVNAALNACAH